MTVRQLLTNLDSRELSEWMAYFQIEAEGKEPPKEALDTKIVGAFTQFGKGA